MTRSKGVVAKGRETVAPQEHFGHVLIQQPDAVAGDESGLEGRVLAAGGRVFVKYLGAWVVQGAPATTAGAPREVRVFEVAEEAIVEEAHIPQHGRFIESSTRAWAEDR